MTSQNDARLRQHPKRKAPRWRDLSFDQLIQSSTNLGIVELPILVLLALLTGLLTLAVRILLLLSGFLPAALLLTRLLPRVLVLLAGILVLIGHCDLPFSKSQGENWGTHHWLRRKLGSALAFSGSSTPWFRRPPSEGDKKLLLYKLLRRRPAQLPRWVPAVKNRNDATSGCRSLRCVKSRNGIFAGKCTNSRQRMDYFAQQLINGIVLGSIYGLIAIGYTMVYGIVGMINFAHGDIFMIGGFIALITFLILVSIGLTMVPVILLIVLLVSMAVTALYGWTIERIAYRPLRHSFRLAPMLSAIGMSFVLINYSQISQGARVKPIPPVITGGYTLLDDGGFVVRLSNAQIIVVITTIVLLAIFTWLVSRTRLGRDMRACEQDQTMAALLGVDVDRTISMTFVIGAALAAVAGMMYLLYYGLVDFFMGFVAGIKAFTAAVLGGIGSLPGAMLGGLLIGLIETMWSAYFSVEYKDVAAFSILIVVLIFLPTGLLGRPEVEKV
jgi:branched-chain amino acid transport system permease protein